MKITGPMTALVLGTTVLYSTGAVAAADRLKNDFSFTYHIEVAGADESNVATDKELRESGINMVPAQPTAASRDPLKKPAPPEIKTSAPEPVPAAEAKSKPVAAKTEGDTQTPAQAAQQTTPEKTSSADEKPAAAMKKEMASANDALFRPYLRIDGGYAMTSNPDGTGRNGPHRNSETQDTGLVSLGIGTRVEEQVRLEGLLSYRSPMGIDGTDGAGNIISGEVGSMSAMLNLYYDISEAHEWLGSDIITPYIGAGIGVSMLDTDSMTTGGNTERGTQVYNLTYAAMAGLASKISEQITLDIGYRFINLGQYEQDGSFTNGSGTTATKYDDLLAHEFRAGLRFQF